MSETIGLEAIATAFRRSAYNAWSNVLIGNAPPDVQMAYERMRNPVVGDWVFEATTIYGMRHENATDLDGIGILEEDTREPFVFTDPDFIWDEESEGKPHPTERVFYIRTMDGRRFRWVNARLIAILTDLRRL